MNSVDNENIIIEKSLSVSGLIRKLHCILNITRDLSSDCTCMFKLHNVGNKHKLCPIHPYVEKNTLVTCIMNNFIDKNIQYINSYYCMDIIYSRVIRMLLPLILNLHQNYTNNSFHLSTENIPKLNSYRVDFINLLIINTIQCNDCHSCSRKTSINANKIITFKYLIIINCTRDNIQRYIERNDDGYFKIYIGQLLTNKYVRDPLIS